MEAYHGGLEKLIGQPHVDVVNQMEWEHKKSPYAQTLFENGTNGNSTASQEYDYTAHFSGAVENEEKGRNGYTIEELMLRSAGLIKRSGLQVAEVIALRLYTGKW
jgi:hypothetical protein